MDLERDLAFPFSLDELLAYTASYLKLRGATRELELLAKSTPYMAAINGEYADISIDHTWRLRLTIDAELYLENFGDSEDNADRLARRICDGAQDYLSRKSTIKKGVRNIVSVNFIPSEIIPDADWRKKTLEVGQRPRRSAVPLPNANPVEPPMYEGGVKSNPSTMTQGATASQIAANIRHMIDPGEAAIKEQGTGPPLTSVAEKPPLQRRPRPKALGFDFVATPSSSASESSNREHSDILDVATVVGDARSMGMRDGKSNDALDMLIAIDELEEILHLRATRLATPKEEEDYKRIRRQLVGHQEARQILPKLIGANPNLATVWSLLKSYSTWQERREFISGELAQLRSWFEGKGIISPPEGSATITRKETAIMSESKPMKIFLSHKGIDKPMVHQYHEVLRLLGFDPWIDDDAMTLGDNLERGLLKGMKESCAAIFFATPSFADEKYIGAEIDYAIMQKRERGDDFVIMTLVFHSKDKKGKVPELFAPYIWGEPINGLDGLKKILKSLPARVGPVVWGRK